MNSYRSLVPTRWLMPLLLAVIVACAKVSPPPAAKLSASPTSVARPQPPRSHPTCAAEPLRTQGRVHYVCDCATGAAHGCVPGSDGNDGLAPASPLRSYAKAAEAFASLAAGDTIAFCRGGRWNLTTGAGWANSNCRKDSTCDVRDYAPPWAKGDQPPPSLWIDGGDTGTTLMTFIHPPRHFEGYRVLNLDLHGGKTDVALFFFNQTTDVDLCNLASDGFGISVQIAGGDSPALGVSSRIVLRDSRITNNANIAYLAVCDDCAVEDNVFDDNGVRDVFTHSIYFASQAYQVAGRTVVHTSHGMRLSRNQIHHSKRRCLGAPVVVHGRHQDVVIEDNVVDAAEADDRCWGPGVGCGGYAYGCWFRGAIIRNNVFKGLGNVATDNSNCVGCTIENNLFLMNRDGTAISLGGAQPRPEGDPAYTQWDGSPDAASDFAVIRNNTFYFGEAATSATAITLYSGRGHVIENNAMVFAPGNDRGHAQAGGHTRACYRLTAAPTGMLAGADFNLCSLGGDRWASYPPSRAVGLGDWQKIGFDRHSRWVSPIAPLFDDAPAGFVPAAGSPLVDAADPSNSPRTDIVRKPRDARPDIGAYER